MLPQATLVSLLQSQNPPLQSQHPLPQSRHLCHVSSSNVGVFAAISAFRHVACSNVGISAAISASLPCCLKQLWYLCCNLRTPRCNLSIPCRNLGISAMFPRATLVSLLQSQHFAMLPVVTLVSLLQSQHLCHVASSNFGIFAAISEPPAAISASPAAISASLPCSLGQRWCLCCNLSISPCCL